MSVADLKRWMDQTMQQGKQQVQSPPPPPQPQPAIQYKKEPELKPQSPGNGNNLLFFFLRSLACDFFLKYVCYILVLSYVYSKQPIFGLTQEWLRELSFSRLECGVHDRLHISSADWWDNFLALA